MPKDILESHENYFVFTCFGDLKNYDFFYRVSLVQGSEKIKTTKGKKLKKAFNSEQIEAFKQSILAYLSTKVES